PGLCDDPDDTVGRGMRGMVRWGLHFDGIRACRGMLLGIGAARVVVPKSSWLQAKAVPPERL
ncbi:hypothetical protein, partial [Mesorhizobium sp.]|uniref:hypothetical protein n=1 Tax=Mesorhizobium sp. TaxID=1871066 RepID=UPI0025CCFFE7